eukprot:11768884-Alexandrium_andersonii.AAC.1
MVAKQGYDRQGSQRPLGRLPPEFVPAVARLDVLATMQTFKELKEMKEATGGEVSVLKRTVEQIAGELKAKQMELKRLRVGMEAAREDIEAGGCALE